MNKVITFLLLSLFCTGLSANDLIPIQNDKIKAATARIMLYDEDDDFQGYCSGVLISKDIVLTARHCVELLEAPYVILGAGRNIEQLIVDRYSTIDQPNSLYNLFDNDSSLSDDYEENYFRLLGKDLLLLHLRENSKAEPIQLYKKDLTDKTPLFPVGFPKRTTHYESTSYDTIRLPVSNLSTCFIDHRDKRHEAALSTDCITTKGNSGGPVYTIENGEVFLVGIVSTSFSKTTVNLNGRNENTTYMINLRNAEILKWLKFYLNELKLTPYIKEIKIPNLIFQ